MHQIPHLCRDCFEEFANDINNSSANSRCPNCASSRIICHKELHTLSMAHVDCDAFFASVEKRDNPDLIDKPLIIGGGNRGVVATCCYIARMSGIHSAMPMFTARKKCPEAVIIRPQMHKYSKVSKEIRHLMNALTPLVEPLSIDEAFLDLAGTEQLHKSSPAKTLAKFAKKVEEEIGVSVSIGLSHNKFLAKIASDLDKPRGMALIGKQETKDFLASKPISIIYGVGKVLTQTLKNDGFVTIGQLQNHDRDDLIRRYGETGARLWRLGKGEDTRSVTIRQKVKSISNETTFNNNISQLDALSTVLLSLCEKVSQRMKKQYLAGDTITLKLKTADFKSITRARHLSLPTHLAHIMYENAYGLLEKEINRTSFRLIGIGMSGLEKSSSKDPRQDPRDLLDPAIARKAAAERAMDKVRDKFGSEAVVRGKIYRQKVRKNKIPE